MDPDLVDAATRRLRAAKADDFTDLRRALVDEATAAGDVDAARAIGKVRKPTNAARIVNAFVTDDADAVERLTALGDELRDAQQDLDAARMRELATRRRSLVGDCTKRALALAGAADASATVRDDVSGTFDAAVADPDVAARLGTLQRPERFSGFGFSDSAKPRLTLVRGGAGERTGTKDDAARQPPAKSKISPSERRKRKRALDEAQQRFDAADSALDAAATDERDAVRSVRKRERELAKAKEALDAARSAVDASRATLKDARRERREARSALDREQRRAPD
jgi:hypothetical protein